MATAPAFAGTPKYSSAQLGTANTARDSTGTIETVFTAGASGSRIDTIHIKAVNATTAGMIRLWLYDGSNTRLWIEIPVDVVVTPGATVPTWEYNINSQQHPDLLPLSLGASQTLRASTHNAEVFNVLVTFAGDM